MQCPLLPRDCPDPCVLRIEEPTPSYVLVATTYVNARRDKFPLYRSRDMLRWEEIGHVFPAGSWPSWAVSEFWAPEIHRIGERYVCYFTARDRSGRLCLGAAEASAITGPWADLGRPLLRDDRVGLIDAHRFADVDGRHYLYFKEDGNDLSPRAPTPILGQELSPDGLSFRGERTTVLVNDLSWEAHVIEGPWVVHRGAHYYLFYSGNAFHTDAYGTGVARGPGPLGPFEKSGAPILVSSEAWRGPGHGCVVEVDGADYFVYHAWEGDLIHGDHPRLPLVGRIEWTDGWPRIVPPVQGAPEPIAEVA